MQDNRDGGIASGKTLVNNHLLRSNRCNIQFLSNMLD